MLIFRSPYHQLWRDQSLSCFPKSINYFLIFALFFFSFQKADHFLQNTDFLKKKKTLFVLFFSIRSDNGPRSAKSDPLVGTAIPGLPVHHHTLEVEVYFWKRSRSNGFWGQKKEISQVKKWSFVYLLATKKGDFSALVDW